MADTFKIGDTVCLKSKGHVMTVEKITKKRIGVVWSEIKTPKLIRDSVLPDTIEICDPPEDGTIKQITGMQIIDSNQHL